MVHNRTQISIPLLDGKFAFYPGENIVKLSQEFYFESNHKSALTDLRDIGKFFAKILLDEKTINQYVFCYSEEKSQKELFDMVESVSGKKIPKISVRFPFFIYAYMFDIHSPPRLVMRKW